MRLTRETLIKIARDTASQRARVSRRIICIYLTGSVLGESPLLGGTTDIDLVIIHDSEPLQPREVVRLSDEIHLDISHYDQALFHQPRHLRADPWLGPFIYSKPMVLHDTQHWFDFTQAATGAQFLQPDYVLQRATTLAQAARQSWMNLEFNPTDPHPRRVYGLLKTLENAGNALACLTGEGKPLTERRFLLHLPQRLHELNRPDLVSGLVSLFLPDPSHLETVWAQWGLAWEEAFKAASSQADVPPRLQPFRQLYYERAMAALWEENPGAALWLLLRTWTLSVSHLPENSPQLESWLSACQFLKLDAAHFADRLQSLDHYLDSVEETLESWANANGVSSIAEA
jgi:hypothetical protein